MATPIDPKTSRVPPLQIIISDKLVPVSKLGLPDDIRVLSKISQGGMGLVLKAESVRTKAPLAVKMLLPRQAAERRDVLRFNQEAEIIASLSNPHIVSMYDFGCTPAGIPYLIMEFIEGVTLADLHTVKPPSFDEASEILSQICDALDHAHRAGIIHRDLKPSNIMVTVDSDDKILVKVVDFGIAKLAAASDDETLVSLTMSGDVLGTPAYMSPEQALDEPVDQRSDIYSLGCVMYFVVTGNPPHAGGTPFKVVAQHTAKEGLPPISSVRKDIPKELAFVIDKMVERNPAERYQSVRALLHDLRKDQEQKSFSARLSGRQRRLLRSVLILAITVFASFCIGWLGFAIFHWFQARQASGG